ncbi:bifunctional [glutamine synthetase] adenylyltransferase/[glutamine synthetase]-adenylyl-L-tyrosine phosphorylase [Naasia lichenicola]|uniref:Bifunctional [glutamine synthetase] adenylyltransferase/[glutamine synthetase]-adenylyl-L-tyrosine phosphorylase n=1 Tax=Naasia lichenicola TaxID=2565933 RepID=A0A4S4FRL7_9MICO|nr:bifunctional [glutamine synthetase] adenylyltransferase/[glutamine synthetase]-adenylyl-L-tyrosine phosphorylase [Naasia lichenicola]THG32941.1 bifunctional [glutamine synthetase] adenylyltransferase/[glutamine synthetase]-adenylyl-L-tyrosine phosphorylase [Naasia lichenicola]
MRRELMSLTEMAKLGFADLGTVADRLVELEELGRTPSEELLSVFGDSADPDQALDWLISLGRRHPDALRSTLASAGVTRRLVRALGASSALGEFVLRHPEQIAALGEPIVTPPTPEELTDDLLASVGAQPTGVATVGGDKGRVALRVAYRRQLLRLAAWDLGQPRPVDAIHVVTAALADLASAALDASLAVARLDATRRGTGPGVFSAEVLAQTRLAIIGMGKAGARELNYVSDVDVIFVAECATDTDIAVDRMIPAATRLAMLTMQGVHETAVEPPLWEVDANLRPEGKDGALVRTLESHIAYYDRWAKDWEFQALLKARPLAGDRELGERYVEALAPKVWSSASRPNFVEQVQRMRERVTDFIPADEREVQLKLGPGGLRDIEFTVQLLQLVHGQTDPSVRERGTLRALDALAAAGYIGRTESAEFAEDYRVLRLLEHRLQLEQLSRTHLMPRDEERLRVLARATRLGSSAKELTARWQRTKRQVRSLHERLFYRPLLSAVARLPEQSLQLTSAQAEARLKAIGFIDPHGALAHIAALTQGVSRRATMQRTLLPVLLEWFAAGANPDAGLLAFRRISESLGETAWYLRMLRDSQAAAFRLTQVLAGSRFVVELMELYPEATRWLEDDEQLRPRSWDALREETLATVARHADRDSAAAALRTARRREYLRLALAGILGIIRIEELGQALSSVTSAILTGVLRSIRRDEGPWPEFAIIAMGRYGGAELGFGSDADIIYVYRPIAGMAPELAQSRAEFIVSEFTRLTEDHRLPLDLDIGLRPEGKNGAVVRSLRSYEAYYQRWSLTWEAQALLRARGVAGDHGLVQDFTALADRVRYPRKISENDVREVKRIKARVENERLPHGADPARHLKLGRGTLSDVEWLVQLLQLQHGSRVKGLRTPSTLAALAAAESSRLLKKDDAAALREAWILASRLRSAMTLSTNKTSDILPSEVTQLDGVARLLEYPPGSAALLEEHYLRVTRRSRTVFERLFYGEVERLREPTF